LDLSLTFSSNCCISKKQIQIIDLPFILSPFVMQSKYFPIGFEGLS